MTPDAEKLIVTQCMRNRMALPDKIQNAPELELGLELYFGAFFDLSTCRPATGMGVSPIPWGAINEYAGIYMFDDEQREELLYFIRSMDAVYLKHHSPKESRDRPLGKDNGKFR